MNKDENQRYPDLMIGKATMERGRVTRFVIQCRTCDMGWQDRTFPSRHAAMVALNEHREMHLREGKIKP